MKHFIIGFVVGVCLSIFGHWLAGIDHIERSPEFLWSFLITIALGIWCGCIEFLISKIERN